MLTSLEANIISSLLDKNQSEAYVFARRWGLVDEEEVEA
jgi:hypothetical protein